MIKHVVKMMSVCKRAVRRIVRVIVGSKEWFTTVFAQRSKYSWC